MNMNTLRISKLQTLNGLLDLIFFFAFQYQNVQTGYLNSKLVIYCMYSRSFKIKCFFIILQLAKPVKNYNHFVYLIYNCVNSIKPIHNNDKSLKKLIHLFIQTVLLLFTFHYLTYRTILLIMMISVIIWCSITANWCPVLCTWWNYWWFTIH